MEGSWPQILDEFASKQSDPNAETVNHEDESEEWN